MKTASPLLNYDLHFDTLTHAAWSLQVCAGWQAMVRRERTTVVQLWKIWLVSLRRILEDGRDLEMLSYTVICNKAMKKHSFAQLLQRWICAEEQVSSGWKTCYPTPTVLYWYLCLEKWFAMKNEWSWVKDWFMCECPLCSPPPPPPFHQF